MAAIRSLWVALTTEDRFLAGSDANMFLEFGQSGKSIKLPDQPGNDTEQPGLLGSNGTTYLFDVNSLATEEFVPGTVSIRNDNTALAPGWRCESILVVGVGEDGKYYPLVAMPHVHRWLAASEPEGLTINLDVLKSNEVGVI